MGSAYATQGTASAVLSGQPVMDRGIVPPFSVPDTPFTLPEFSPPSVQPTVDKVSEGLGDIFKPKGSPGVIRPQDIRLQPGFNLDATPKVDTKISEQLKPALVPRMGQIPRLRPITDIVPRQDVIPRQTAKLDTPARLKPLFVTPRFLRAPVQQGRIVRPKIPVVPPPPFWLQSAKKRRKPDKKKKGKKKTLVWQVPDWWGGYYDPEEYKVIGKTAKTPRKFLTGNFGFDTEFK